MINQTLDSQDGDPTHAISSTRSISSSAAALNLAHPIEDDTPTDSIVDIPTAYLAEPETEATANETTAAPRPNTTFPSQLLHSASSSQFLTPLPVIAADLIGMVLSASVAMLILHLASTSTPQTVSLLHVAALLPLMVFTYWCCGLYPGVGVHPVGELRTIAKLNTTAFIAALAALEIAGASGSLCILCTMIWALSGVAIPLFRTAARHHFSRYKWWGYPTLVISSGSAVRETIIDLQFRPHSGLRPCGIIDPTGTGSGHCLDIPYINAIEGSPVGLYGIVALPDISREAMLQIVDVYRDRFSHLFLVSGRCGMPTLLRDERHYGGGLAGTELANKLLLPWHCFVKRAIDLGLVLAAAPVWLAVLGLLAGIVKLTSAGPMFYGQRRLGKNKKPFTAWKLRTMQCNSDDLLKSHLASNADARAEWELDHKLRNDPRVTRIGRFLRKTSLDEIPQFWNVLRGDMSLVGPRPIVRDEISKYGKIYRLYSQVPPGITGLWQISGRNNTTYEERVLLDDFYVRNWSPWLDVYVLARTVYTLIRRDGAF